MTDQPSGGEQRKAERRVEQAEWTANMVGDVLVFRREEVPWRRKADQFYAWHPERRVQDRRVAQQKETPQ